MKNKTKENTKFVMWKSFRYERTFPMVTVICPLDVHFQKSHDRRYQPTKINYTNLISIHLKTIKQFLFMISLFRHLNDILMNGNNYLITWPAAFSLNHSM